MEFDGCGAIVAVKLPADDGVSSPQREMPYQFSSARWCGEVCTLFAKAAGKQKLAKKSEDVDQKKTGDVIEGRAGPLSSPDMPLLPEASFPALLSFPPLYLKLPSACRSP